MSVFSFEEARQLLGNRDISGKIFLKKEENRQSIDLPTGYSTTIEDEYEAMRLLYESSSDNVVEPYTLVERPCGYLMEYFPGEHLEVEQLEKPGKVAGQLEELGNDIKENETPHGDIRKDNILVIEGEIKLIDAAGITPGLEGTGPAELHQEVVAWDLTEINDLINEIAIQYSFNPEEYKISYPAVRF